MEALGYQTLSHPYYGAFPLSQPSFPLVGAAIYVPQTDSFQCYSASWQSQDINLDLVMPGNRRPLSQHLGGTGRIRSSRLSQGYVLSSRTVSDAEVQGSKINRNQESRAPPLILLVCSLGRPGAHSDLSLFALQNWNYGYRPSQSDSSVGQVGGDFVDRISLCTAG